MNHNPNTKDQFISIRIQNVLFGLSVQHVQDVIYTPEMSLVPLCPVTIRGLLNLRGRIVTAIDLGIILDLDSAVDSSDANKSVMSVILDVNNELYSFIVDSVGEVITIDSYSIEKKPSNLDERWKQFTFGVYRYEEELMVILDENKIFAEALFKTGS